MGTIDTRIDISNANSLTRNRHTGIAGLERRHVAIGDQSVESNKRTRKVCEWLHYFIGPDGFHTWMIANLGKLRRVHIGDHHWQGAQHEAFRNAGRHQAFELAARWWL